MKNIKLILSLLLLGGVILKFCFPILNISASTTDSINIKVGISVCGNFVSEGGENCDNSDLNGGTCSSLGYQSGILSCDISCSYDTKLCVPFSSPSPTSVETVSSSTTTPSLISNLLSPSNVSPTLTPSDRQISIPEVLKAFYVNTKGQIEIENIYESIKTWVDAWKTFLVSGEKSENSISQNKCDISKDGVCNLKDLSILLYFVER